jgi:3-hydroxyisobutyrate dehydrogenase
MTAPTTSSDMTRVGFIGLGSQGAPMARQIVDAGYPTTLWARRAETLEPFADSGATFAATPAEVGAAASILCICVIDDAGVDEVLRGDGGALSTLADGSVIIIHSTVRPSTCIRLQQDYPAFRVLDAPVSGGGLKAASRELVVMVGGPTDVFEECRPVLETFANPLLHFGELGAGSEAKLLNNTLFTAQLGLAAEVFEIARARGIDQDALSAMLETGSGRSFAADIVRRSGFNLDPMAANAGSLLAKDVGILAAHAALTDSRLLDTADGALERMGVGRQPKEHPNV